MSSDPPYQKKNHIKPIDWKKFWIGRIIAFGFLSFFSLLISFLFFPEILIPNLVYLTLFDSAILISYLWQKNITKQHIKEGLVSDSIYLKRIWSALFISYIGSSVFTLIFFQDQFIRFFILTIILGFVFIIAYYIHLKPTFIVNKILYFLLGMTIIGIGLCLLYEFIGINIFLISLGSWYIWLNLINFSILLIVGGFIGYYVGRRVEFRIPYSLH